LDIHCYYKTYIVKTLITKYGSAVNNNFICFIRCRANKNVRDTKKSVRFARSFVSLLKIVSLLLNVLLPAVIISAADRCRCQSTVDIDNRSRKPKLRDISVNTPCLKKHPTLACYNFDTHERILTFLAEILPTKYATKRRFTMPHQITCASALPCKTGKHENHICHSLGLCYTHNAPVRCFPERNKKASIR